MIEKFIIVVDDDEDDQLLLQSAFVDIGCQSKIVFVNNGISLLQFLEKNYNGNDPDQKPCIILLDLNMGIKNGKEVLKDLKSDSDFKEIPVLMYSTSQTEADKKDCYALGAETYIVKPFHYSALLKVVEDIRYSWLLSDKKSTINN